MNKTIKKLDKTRRAVVRTAGAALALALASAVAVPSLAQAAYPDRPVKFIVPYSPGGLGDSFARLVAQGLSERLGQAVIVENMPGASQAIGAAAAAKAAPDGYTLFMGTQSGLVLNTIAQKKVPFDAVKDFAPVSMLFSSPLYLVVHPSVAAKTVPELIALAKSKPDELTVATIGDGTSTNLGALMFQKRAGVKFMHVPYKGSAPAITDVLAGRVDVFFEGGASALPYVRQGKLRALASTAEERTEKAAPGLPTLKESFPGLSLEVWFGIVAPAGTPRPIIDLLNKEIKAVQKTARIHELAANLGADVVPSTPEELGERIRKELVEYTTIMRAAK